ncbi:hypothetical protein KJ662_00490, partial [Patescibacteria group bacterium]|nr:hypothetical protein [Patescibacteria group bacterium]
CLVIISIATSGCVMQVDETEDFDAIELELAEATETDVKFAQEPLACVRDINDNCMQLVDEPGQITMHESIIEVDPTKLPPARTLQVGVDHSAATIKVYDTDMYIVAEMKAADCPVPHTLVIQIDVF